MSRILHIKEDIFCQGQLHIICGPMFSNKTTHLRKEMGMFADIGESVIFINHSIDNRFNNITINGDEFSSTHKSNVGSLPSNVDKIKVTSLKSVDVSDYSYIGIDESQFFDDLVPTVTHWVKNLNKIVYCAGLDGSYEIKTFGHLLELIPLSNSVVKLLAKCHYCLKESFINNDLASSNNYYVGRRIVDAPYTLKIGGEINDESCIEVGGKDKYVPVCLYHYKFYSHHDKDKKDM